MLLVVVLRLLLLRALWLLVLGRRRRGAESRRRRSSTPRDSGEFILLRREMGGRGVTDEEVLRDAAEELCNTQEKQARWLTKDDKNARLGSQHQQAAALPTKGATAPMSFHSRSLLSSPPPAPVSGCTAGSFHPRRGAAQPQPGALCVREEGWGRNEREQGE